MGAITQFRTMGGAIGLSIVNTVMHTFLKSRLRNIITSADALNKVLDSAQSIAALDPATRLKVVLEFSEGYNIQMRILAGLAAVQLLGSAVMWQRRQIRV